MESTPQHKGSNAQKLLWVFLIGLLFLLPVWGRCLYESRQSLLTGQEAQQQRDTQRAIRSFAKAVRWRSFANPFAVEAQGELLEMETELSGAELVLLLKELRRALFLSRSIYFESDGEWLLIERIDRRLQELGARVPVDVLPPQPLRPAFDWQITAQIGFWGWIVAVLMTARLGYTSQGKMVTVRFMLAATSALTLFLLWLFALGRA
jgi:hypothetical protein